MKSLITLVLGVMLAGCAEDIKPHTSADHYQYGKTPLHFNVGRIDFIKEINPGFEDKHRQTHAYTKLDKALQDWAHKTFINRGFENTLVVIVEKAKILETDLVRKGKLFRVEESERYDGHITVRLELKDPHGHTLQSLVTTAMHSQTVLENISDHKREKKIDELVLKLIDELDDRVRDNVKEHLSGYISY